MDVVGDEDGGWARLARCPYGVQENNRGGRGLITEAGTILSVLGVQSNLCAFRSAWDFPAHTVR